MCTYGDKFILLNNGYMGHQEQYCALGSFAALSEPDCHEWYLALLHGFCNVLIFLT